MLYLSYIAFSNFSLFDKEVLMINIDHYLETESLKLAIFPLFFKVS